MTSLFLDWSNLKYRALHVALKENPWDTEKFANWKQIMFGLLRHYTRRFQPRSVIVAGDGTSPWRKRLFPAYKSSRNHDTEIYARLKVVENEFWEALKTMLPNIKWMRLDFAEADDIIAVLSKNVPNYDQIVCVSSDKDFVQLLCDPKFLLFCPNKNEFVECEDSAWQLKKKILIGDKSDDIPGIKRGLGPKKAEALRDPVKLWAFLESDAEAMANYVRNSVLIDMAKIPDEVQSSILVAYRKQTSSFDASAFSKTFLKLFPAEMTALTENCAIFSDII